MLFGVESGASPLRGSDNWRVTRYVVVCETGWTRYVWKLAPAAGSASVKSTRLTKGSSVGGSGRCAARIALATSGVRCEFGMVSKQGRRRRSGVTISYLDRNFTNISAESISRHHHGASPDLARPLNHMTHRVNPNRERTYGWAMAEMDRKLLRDTSGLVSTYKTEPISPTLRVLKRVK